MKVVILTGGKGTRLGLSDRPKPMVPVNGVPLLERLVGVAKDSGLSDFIFLNGHLGKVIEDYFGDGGRFGAQIAHLREATPLGTAGAIRDARHLLTETFIVIYGDILIDVDLRHFAGFHKQKGGLGSLFAHPNDHPHDSDLIQVDDDARILRLLSKPHPENMLAQDLVSAALYVLEPGAMDFVAATRASDWGKDVFPAIVDGGKPLYAYRSLEYAKDIGTLDRLAKGEADLESGRVARLSRRYPKPAIFFDRDGVLNKEINGVHRPEDLALAEGAGAAVKAVNRTGIPAICVTNQPDIAKGFMTGADLRRVLAALDTGLAEQGAYLDDIYYCPHHPERGWPGEVAALKVDCECRKPKPGMLREAAETHNLDLARSWLIGDRLSDVDAAHAAGAHAVLIGSPIAGKSGTRSQIPDFIAGDIAEAVTYVLGLMR